MILVICVEDIVKQFSKFVKAAKFLLAPHVIYNNQNFAQEANFAFSFHRLQWINSQGKARPAELREPQRIHDDWRSKEEPHVSAKKPGLLSKKPVVRSLQMMKRLCKRSTWPTHPEPWGKLFVYIKWSCLHWVLFKVGLGNLLQLK